MMVSTRGRYALCALVDLAENREGGNVTLREIAQRQDISVKYLESIVKQLVCAGILVGIRGKGGGYRLTREPEEVPVLDVLLATEGTLVPVSCIRENSVACCRSWDCRTLPLWKGLDGAVRDYLKGYTLRDLMR